MRVVKVPVPLIASSITLFLVPIGLAVADYADTRASERKQDNAQVPQLIAEGKVVLAGVARDRKSVV
jgi:hypothetical protein